MGKFKFTTHDYILYLLNRLRPDASDKIKLNKIAFLVEFGYKFKTRKELSDAQYAGINLGAVINDYKEIFEDMEKSKKIKIDGYTIRPLQRPGVDIPKEISAIIDPLIEKYSSLTNSELVALAHDTDSYRITTNSEKEMGKIIDKDLAALESFFEESNLLEIPVSDLPKLKEKDLEKYELG